MDSSCHVSQLFSLLPAITYVNLNFHQMSWIVCSAPAAAWQIFSLGFSWLWKQLHRQPLTTQTSLVWLLSCSLIQLSECLLGEAKNGYTEPHFIF